MTIQPSDAQPKHYNNLFSQIASECCHKWFKDPSEGIIDILVYPAVGITFDQLRTLIKVELPQKQNGRQGILATADIQDMRIIDFTSHVLVNTDGPRLSLPTEVIRELEFNGPALLIAIPKDHSSLDNPISIIIPLLRLYRGSAIAWGNPIRISYNVKTQAEWIAQSIGKSYSPNTEGPFDGPKIKQDISETLSVLLESANPDQDRAVFALELFNQANESIKTSLRTRIFHYWGAIETLCDSNKENILLSHLFDGRPDKVAPENQKLFTDARTLRHNVIHKGHTPFSDSYILERYLQVIFLDILRNILKLPYAGYVEQFANHHGTSWLQEKYIKRK